MSFASNIIDGIKQQQVEDETAHRTQVEAERVLREELERKLAAIERINPPTSGQEIKTGMGGYEMANAADPEIRRIVESQGLKGSRADSVVGEVKNQLTGASKSAVTAAEERQKEKAKTANPEAALGRGKEEPFATSPYDQHRKQMAAGSFDTKGSWLQRILNDSPLNINIDNVRYSGHHYYGRDAKHRRAV